MIEVLDGTMVYCTKDEKKLIERLRRIKKPDAEYFKGKKRLVKVGYHWKLHSITIGKLKKYLTSAQYK